MARLLLGKEVNQSLSAQIREKTEKLAGEGTVPVLAIIRVGAREDDLSYERGASKRCEALGIEVRSCVYPQNVTQEELERAVIQINSLPEIHGILLLRPLPDHLEEEAVIRHISPQKDVDGITEQSKASVYAQSGNGYAPCTAKACLAILKHYQIELSGKNVVVIGRSMVIGKPAAMLLLEQDATVTICHSKTKSLPKLVKQADIVIAAVGKAELIDQSYLSPHQIVIDVGIHVNDAGKLCGDVKLAEAGELVAAVTPVPGGVGAVTTTILAGHVVDAAARMIGLQ